MYRFFLEFCKKGNFDHIITSLKLNGIIILLKYEYKGCKEIHNVLLDK